MEPTQSNDHTDQIEPDRKETSSAIPPRIKRQTQILTWISGIESLAGMYALLLTSVGVALPLSQYTSANDFTTRGRHYTGFSLYIYGVAIIFQVYITIRAKIYRVKKKQFEKKLKRQSKSESETNYGGTNEYGHVETAISENSRTTNPLEIFWLHNEAPSVYEAKWGFNLFTRLGILVFGLCAVALEICKIVTYVWERDKDGSCHRASSLAVFILRAVFFLNQSFFLFAHHRVVFNFHRPVVKFGLLHLVSANIIAWVLAIVQDSVEVYVLLDREEHQNETVNGTVSGSTFADRVCLSHWNLEYVASRYITPLVIGYCLLAATILYRMYVNVGTRVYHTRHLPEVWETDASSWPRTTNTYWIALTGGILLFLATCGLTGWVLYLDSMQDDIQYLHTMGTIFSICDLVLNTIGLVSLVPAFYQINKLVFSGACITIDQGQGEHVLMVTLGGFFLFLGFITVAATRSLGEQSYGPPMALTVCLLGFAQSSAQYLYTFDAIRRRISSIEKMPGKSMVIFLVFINLSMWLVNSFQLRSSVGSVLFYRRYNVLPWIMIINATLPLAMYYRYLTCVLLVDVLRGTYGVHYVGNKWLARLLN